MNEQPRSVDSNSLGTATYRLIDDHYFSTGDFTKTMKALIARKDFASKYLSDKAAGFAQYAALFDLADHVLASRTDLIPFGQESIRDAFYAVGIQYKYSDAYTYQLGDELCKDPELETIYHGWLRKHGATKIYPRFTQDAFCIEALDSLTDEERQDIVNEIGKLDGITSAKYWDLIDAIDIHIKDPSRLVELMSTVKQTKGIRPDTIRRYAMANLQDILD